MNATVKTNLQRAQEAWSTIPDWVTVLAQECDRLNQKRVAALLGYSPAVVNTVLKNTYTGDLSAVEHATRGALLSATVDCPVLGELRANRCLTHQRQPFAATNPQRVKLYRACRSCKNNRIGR